MNYYLKIKRKLLFHFGGKVMFPLVNCNSFYILIVMIAHDS